MATYPKLSEETRERIIESIPNFYTLSSEDKIKETVKAIASDFLFFCERNLLIRDKYSNQLIPFYSVLNWEQKELVRMVSEDLAHGRPVRYIILKARQLGMSTLIEAMGYWWTSTHRFSTTVIIAHEKEATKNLYEMFRRYYEYSHPAFKPDRKYNTKQDLTFDVSDEVKKSYDAQGLPSPGLQSEIKTMVAAEGKGRSSTIKYFHGCMHPDSPIILADGSSTTAGDISVGDSVFTSSGAIAPVKYKIHTGRKMTYKINTWMSNEPALLSADHKVLTIDGYKRVKDLTSKDWVAKPKYKFEDRDSIHYSYTSPHRPQNGGSHVERDEDLKLDYHFGYMVGYYLAEGHVKSDLRRVTFTYNKKEHYVDAVRRHFSHQGRDKVVDNRGITDFGDTFMAHMINHYYGRVDGKHIPLFGNEKYYKGLLAGYLDGDGSKTQIDKISATSVHERIARNINRIGDMLGHHPSLRTREAGEYYGRNCKKVYTNVFNVTTNKPWIRKCKIIDGCVYVRVKSISEYEMADTLDIEIDHPDHNFETPIGVISNSEVAFWDDSADVTSAAVQAVPMAPETFIFLESTANGIGGYFYDEWNASKRGESQYTPVFFPWHSHDEYEVANIIDEDLGELDPEEEALYKLFESENYPRDSWPRKVYWRRMKKKEFRTDPKKFYQEYPSTPEEAFLASGRPVFDVPRLQEMERIAVDAKKTMPYKCGEIKKVIDPETGTERVGFINVRRVNDHDPTPLRMWWDVERGRKYVIGVDVSEGIEVESSSGKEADFSVITVFDVKARKTVARWRGYADPDQLGEVVFNIGTYYNNALVGVEINNHGIATAAKLRNMFYRNLYMRETAEDEQFQVRTTKFGWQTNKKTKPIMISELQRSIREGDIIDLDIVFIREAMSYIRKDNGAMEAQQGQHDDVVMSTAIALQMADWSPYDTDYASKYIQKPLKRYTNATTRTTATTRSTNQSASGIAKTIERRRQARAAYRRH